MGEIKFEFEMDGRDEPGRWTIIFAADHGWISGRYRGVGFLDIKHGTGIRAIGQPRNCDYGGAAAMNVVAESRPHQWGKAISWDIC